MAKFRDSVPMPRVWSVFIAVAVSLGMMSAAPVGAAGVQISLQPCLATPPGLVSLWRGEGTAADAQGVNDGTLQGGGGFTAGKYGGAFNFDGVDDALVIPASASLALEDSFTLEFWFSFPVDIVPGSPRFIQGTHLVNKGWTDFLGIQNGGGDLELGFDNPRMYSTTKSWLANIWYHTALSYDHGWYELYVNGSLEATLYRNDPLLGDLEEILFSQSLATPWNPAAWYAQRLDEIAVYDRPLTAEEVSSRAGNCIPSYDFAGFFSPVDNLPVTNTMNAGRAVPLKFTLAGDQGLDILAPGYPWSEQINCDSAALVDGVEETATVDTSSLSYDPATSQYKYLWKTDPAWADSCRQLVVKLNDGSYHRANYKFE
jgi:hypothetical protein